MRALVKLSTPVLLVLAVGAPDASGQATAGMELAGGSLRGSGVFAGGSDVGIKVSPAGDRVTVRAAGAVPCGRRTSREGHGTGSGPIHPDGSFSVTLRAGAQFREVGFRSTVVASGKITGDRAAGNLRVTTSDRGRNRCTRNLAFGARVVPDLSGAPAATPPAGATLLGRAGTDLAPSGAPFSFNIRVSGDGRRVVRGTSGYFMNWNRRNPDLEETNYLAGARIRSNGTFTDVERVTLRFADGNERMTIRTTGRFVSGGATGTFRVTSVFRSKRSGRVLARGDSGLLRWSAAP